MTYFSRPNLHAYLDRLTSRSVLTKEEQQAVLNLSGQARQVTANCDFIPLGNHVDHVSLVVAGIVGRFDQDGEGARQITALHVPGDICDLHSVVQPLATSALQALSVATILCIPHAEIRAATARYPALAEALWRDCMVDAAILAEWVVNVGRRDAKTRIAHLLCEISHSSSCQRRKRRLRLRSAGDADASCRGDCNDRRPRQQDAPKPKG